MLQVYFLQFYALNYSNHVLGSTVRQLLHPAWVMHNSIQTTVFCYMYKLYEFLRHNQQSLKGESLGFLRCSFSSYCPKETAVF